MNTLVQLRTARPLTRTIDIAEWGGPVTLRRISAREQLDVAADLETVEDEAHRGIHTMVRLVTLAVVDDEGVRVFDNEAGRAYLGTESLTVISRVGNEAMLLHDLGSVEETDEQKKTE